MRPVLAALGAILAVLALGCGSALDDSTRAVNASQVALRSTHEALAEMHRADRDRAIAAATTEAQARCLTSEVQASFDPAWDAYEAARRAWLVAHASVAAARAAEAARMQPDITRVIAAAAHAARAWAALQVAVEQVTSQDPTAAPACADGGAR